MTFPQHPPQGWPNQQPQGQPYQQPASPQGWPNQQPQQYPQQYPPPQQPYQQPQQGRPAPDPRSVFQGITNARPSGNQNFVRAGHYLWRIDAVRIAVGFNQEQHLVIEMTCVWSFEQNVQAYGQSGNDPLYRPHQIGEQAVHLLSRKHTSFLGNVKQFASAVSGVDQARVDEEFLAQVIDANLFVGLLIESSAVIQMTRQQRPFTKVTYKRQVPAREVKTLLEQSGQHAALNHLFPNGLLDQMIRAEGDTSPGQAAPAAPPQGQPPQPWQQPPSAPPQGQPPQPWQQPPSAPPQGQPPQPWQQPPSAPPQGQPAQPWQASPPPQGGAEQQYGPWTPPKS